MVYTYTPYHSRHAANTINGSLDRRQTSSQWLSRPSHTSFLTSSSNTLYHRASRTWQRLARGFMRDVHHSSSVTTSCALASEILSIALTRATAWRPLPISSSSSPLTPSLRGTFEPQTSWRTAGSFRIYVFVANHQSRSRALRMEESLSNYLPTLRIYGEPG